MRLARCAPLTDGEGRDAREAFSLRGQKHVGRSGLRRVLGVCRLSVSLAPPREFRSRRTAARACGIGFLLSEMARPRSSRCCKKVKLWED